MQSLPQTKLYFLVIVLFYSKQLLSTKSGREGGLELASQAPLRCPKPPNAAFVAVGFGRCANPCSLFRPPGALAGIAYASGARVQDTIFQ